MRRRILEKEPVRPSTRLTETLVGADATRLKSHRGANEEASSYRLHLKETIPLIKGDLDWIVMKCLEKDRARRYETAKGLAADLKRHLNNEPVSARPPSRLYEFQKTIRRHKAAFVATAAVIIALLLGFAFATAGFLQARRQRDYANLRVYTSDMNLVQQAWDEGNLRRAQALLQKYIPKPGERDLRGFEWRYLWKLCKNESKVSFTNFPVEVRLAISSTGAFAAAGSGRIVKLLGYENERQRELITLQLPNECSAMTALAFLPMNTNVLATASAKTLCFWNIAEQRIVSLTTLSNPAVALAFSRDGGFLAAASGDEQTIELWRVKDRSLVWTRGTPTPVFALGFTPDNTSLISGGGEQSNPLLWDLSSGTSSPFPGEHKGWVNDIAFSPDGKTLATSSNDSTVILWDFASRKLLARLVAPGAGQIQAVRFSPDGRWLVTCHDDSTIRVWDVATRQQKRVLRGHRAVVTTVAFALDGRSILSGSRDQTVKVWDVEPPSPTDVLLGNHLWASTVAFSHDGQRLASTGVSDRNLTIWDVATHRRLADLNKQSTNVGPTAVFSPDGELLAQLADERIQLWDARTLTLRAELTNGFDAASLSFSPNSQILAVAGLALFNLHGITNRLVFWNVATKQKLNKLAAAAAVAGVVSFSHDGKNLAIGYLNGELRLWNYESDRMLAEFPKQRDRIWCLAFSPDDAWLVAGGEEGAVIFHELRTGRAFRPVAGTSTWILGLGFSPDGKTVASAENDGTIKLWNLATRDIALTLRGHLGAASKVSFSPDGNLLASCGADGTVRLWPAASFDEIR